MLDYLKINVEAERLERKEEEVKSKALGRRGNY